MAALLSSSAPFQDNLTAISRHSLQASAYVAQPAPPFEGIVDFTHMPVSHAQFSPYASSSDIAFPHHASAGYHPHPHQQQQQQQQQQFQRADATEWKQSSFFSYRPNEVKHRKRTTRQQLKVLEETFKTTQKPDANVRKSLAAQLDMTPRNVQVWFQNRRAKDKTLAKRAQKVVEDSQGRQSTLDAASPGVLLLETDQFNNEAYTSSNNGHYSEQGTQAHYSGSVHSGSASPVEGSFPKLEMPTPVRASQDLSQPQPFHAATSSISTSFSSLEVDEKSYAIEDSANPLYSRAIFAPRNSLPHIHAPFQQDLQQHQRSYSFPAFPSNVDTSSNLSLTTCASINGVLYPQQRLASSLSQQPAQQSVYNTSYSASVPRVSTGPLPSSDFTFGTAHAATETERDTDTTSFARYQLGSVSGSDTPSSLSGLSQYGSVASLVDSDFASLAAQAYEDDASVPSGWQNEQRRGSVPQAVRPVPANRFGREFSPSSDPESDGSASVTYLSSRSNWTSAYAEESKPNVKSGYQQESFGFNGYVEQETSQQLVDSSFSSTYMPLMEGTSYGSQASSNDVLGSQFSYGSDNRIPFGGYRPVASAGYQFA
jgi:hypothetical protein